MKLKEYLSLFKEGEELTVWDKDYDMEAYFYAPEPDSEKDPYNEAMDTIASKLEVVEVSQRGVTVNLYDVIEKSMDKIVEADIFIDNDIETIMDSMTEILSGYMGEKSFTKFANCLLD